MNQSNSESSSGVEIDVRQVFAAIRKHLWIVAAVTLACALFGFISARFFIAPTYRSSARMYVNNNTERTSGAITSAEITAAKNLLDVYIVILNSESTLDAVLREADLPYTTQQLGKMVSAHAVSNTEVFEITATSRDPAEARQIVDTIINILPDRISEIVEGSSAKVVSEAKLPTDKSAPNVSRVTLISAITGVVISSLAIVVLELLDNTVHDSAYLGNTYDLPVLAVVPDMHGRKHGGYYGEYGRKEGAKDESVRKK